MTHLLVPGLLTLSFKGENNCTLPAPCTQTVASLYRFCCSFKYLSREHQLGFGSNQKELPWISFFLPPSSYFQETSRIQWGFLGSVTAFFSRTSSPVLHTPCPSTNLLRQDIYMYVLAGSELVTILSFKFWDNRTAYTSAASYRNPLPSTKLHSTQLPK